MATFPSAEGDVSQPTATLGGWLLTLDSKSKHPAVSTQFISWLLADDLQPIASFFTASPYSKYTVRKSVDVRLANTAEASGDPHMTIVSE